MDRYTDGLVACRAAGGHVHDRVAANTLVFCAEGRERARGRGAELLTWYRDGQRALEERNWRGIDEQAIPRDYKFHMQAGAATRGGDDVTARELVDQLRFCMGDPDDCCEFVARFEAIGLDELMFQFQLGPATHAEVRESLRLFGRQVIPHFQRPARPAGVAPSG